MNCELYMDKQEGVKIVKNVGEAATWNFFEGMFTGLFVSVFVTRSAFLLSTFVFRILQDICVY